jgi:hypothetical protein
MRTQASWAVSGAFDGGIDCVDVWNSDGAARYVCGVSSGGCSGNVNNDMNDTGGIVLNVREVQINDFRWTDKTTIMIWKARALESMRKGRVSEGGNVHNWKLRSKLSIHERLHF